MSQGYTLPHIKMVSAYAPLPEVASDINMTSFTVRLRFLSKDRETVAGMLRELTSASRAEPGCITYNVHTLKTDPDIVLIYEQYRDDESLEAHRGTPHYERYAKNGFYPLVQEQTLEFLNDLV